MRQDTAPQLAILFDGTRAHAVYIYLSALLSLRARVSTWKLMYKTFAEAVCVGDLVTKS